MGGGTGAALAVVGVKNPAAVPGMSAAGAKVGSAAAVVLSRASKALARVVASNGSGDDKTRERERKTEEVKKTRNNSDRNTSSQNKRRVGESGKYEDLAEKNRPAGGFDDEMEVHHMPSQRFLKEKGLNPKKGFSAVMPKNQHIKTRTFGIRGAKQDISGSYRSEIGRDLNEYMRILKEDGLWTPEVRRSLSKGLNNFRNEYPDLFRKVRK